MRRANLSEQICPIARALDIMGDFWSVLIVRDALAGSTRFDQFRRNLDIARNVLAARLERLVEHGVLERQLYEERPPRHEYLLTDKGRELWRVLLTLGAWGLTFERFEPKITFLHAPCGERVPPSLYCAQCQAPVETKDVRVVPNPAHR